MSSKHLSQAVPKFTTTRWMGNQKFANLNNDKSKLSASQDRPSGTAYQRSQKTDRRSAKHYSKDSSERNRTRDEPSPCSLSSNKRDNTSKSDPLLSQEDMPSLTFSLKGLPALTSDTELSERFLNCSQLHSKEYFSSKAPSGSSNLSKPSKSSNPKTFDPSYIYPGGKSAPNTSSNTFLKSSRESKPLSWFNSQSVVVGAPLNQPRGYVEHKPTKPDDFALEGLEELGDILGSYMPEEF